MRTSLPTGLLDDRIFDGDDRLRLYFVLRFCLEGAETFQIVEDWSSGEHYIVGLEGADGSEIEIDDASEEVRTHRAQSIPISTVDRNRPFDRFRESVIGTS